MPRVEKDAVFDNQDVDRVDTSKAVEILPPTTEELTILREKCDPQRLILG